MNGARSTYLESAQVMMNDTVQAIKKTKGMSKEAVSMTDQSFESVILRHSSSRVDLSDITNKDKDISVDGEPVERKRGRSSTKQA